MWNNFDRGGPIITITCNSGFIDWLIITLDKASLACCRRRAVPGKISRHVTHLGSSRSYLTVNATRMVHITKGSNNWWMILFDIVWERGGLVETCPCEVRHINTYMYIQYRTIWLEIFLTCKFLSPLNDNHLYNTIPVHWIYHSQFFPHHIPHLHRSWNYHKMIAILLKRNKIYTWLKVIINWKLCLSKIKRKRTHTCETLKQKRTLTFKTRSFVDKNSANTDKTTWWEDL